jgi:alkylhydroperoxidase family enzyme
MPPSPVETIPEIMFTLCRFPALWESILDVAAQLQGPESTLPPRDRKLAILRTAWLCQAPYEFGEHVEQAKRIGVTSVEIDAVVDGSGSTFWSDHERAILQVVEELHKSAMVSDQTWNNVAATFDEAQMFELVVLVGQFTATAYFQNALRLRMEPSNAGLAAR